MSAPCYRFDALRAALTDAILAAARQAREPPRWIDTQFDTLASTELWPNKVYIRGERGDALLVMLADPAAVDDSAAADTRALAASIAHRAGTPAMEVVAGFVWEGNDDHGQVRAGEGFVSRWMPILGEGFYEFRDQCKSYFQLTRPAPSSVSLERCNSALPFDATSIDEIDEQDPLRIALAADPLFTGLIISWTGDGVLRGLVRWMCIGVASDVEAALAGAEVRFFLDRRHGTWGARDGYATRALAGATSAALTRLAEACFEDPTAGREILEAFRRE